MLGVHREQSTGSLDGGWSGAIPTRADEIDPLTHRPKDAARYYGRNDEVRGGNDGLLWMDPARRLSNGSYSALVGICLSDQTQPGNGQFGVLKGLHEEVEKVFLLSKMLILPLKVPVLKNVLLLSILKMIAK